MAPSLAQRRWGIVSRWALTACVLLLLGLQPTPPSRAQSTGSRAVELRAEDSGSAAATYTSPFPFQAVGALWREGDASLELRARREDESWTDWHEVAVEDDFPPRSGEVASKLIVVPASRSAEIRARDGRPLPPSLRLVAVDPGVPSDVQVRASSAAAEQLAQLPPPPTPFPFRPVPGGPQPRPGLQLPPTPTRPPAVATPAPTAPALAAPRIISRAEWGADPSLLGWTPEYTTVRKLAIHHTVTSDGGADPAAAIRAIYYYHAVTLGWGDIGYNYIIDRAGNIYEGRAGGPNVVAGHSGPYSRGADGISLLGNFQDSRPSEAMLNALTALLAWRARTQSIDPMGSSTLADKTLPNIFAHRDAMVTDCPGDAAYALLPALRQRVAAVLQGQPLPPLPPAVQPPGSPPAPRPSVSIVGTRIGPSSLSTGDTIQIDITVANTGAVPIATQGPDPGTVYDESDTYRTIGHEEQYGRVRVGVDIEGVVGDHPFRWGLGQDLAPGQTRTVTGFVRLTRTGARTVSAGIVQEGVSWLQERLGQTSVTVWLPGASSYAASTGGATTLSFPLAMKENNGWSTRVVLLNTSSSPARGVLSLAETNGRAASALPFALGPHALSQIDLRTARGLPASFVGSVSAQSDAPLAGVAFHERPDFDRMAVEPASAGTARLYAPLVAKRYNGLSTGVQVQNLGPTATTVAVTYIGGNGSTATESATVPALGSETFYTPASASLPEGFVGSAVIESADGAPLAAQVNELRTDGVAMAYLAEPAGAPTAMAPLLYRRRNGWSSALQIQNLGGTPADVDATYTRTNGAGGPWEQRGLVGHGIGATFYLPAKPDLPDDLVASGFLKSLGSQPILTLVQSVNSVKKIGTVVGSVGRGGQTLYVPWLTNDVQGWKSGVQVANPGSQPAQVTLTFADAQGNRALQVADAIPPSGAKTYYAPAIPGLPPGFVGSLTVQGQPGAALTAVVNDVR